jgi:hypothetical protein
VSRSKFVLAAILVLVTGSFQSSAPKSGYDLDNEYVWVTKGSPVDEPYLSLNLCFNESEYPLIRLAIRTRFQNRKSAEFDKDEPDTYAAYVPSGAPYSCSASRDGYLVLIQMKKIPQRPEVENERLQLDPSSNVVLLDNGRVRVVRSHVHSGELVPLVDNWPSVIMVLSDSETLVTLPNGQTEQHKMKAGEFLFSKTGREATKNTGTMPIETVVVELKAKKK